MFHPPLRQTVDASNNVLPGAQTSSQQLMAMRALSGAQGIAQLDAGVGKHSQPGRFGKVLVWATVE